MHLPVLLNEAISYLAVNPVGTYVDGTVGGGGHLQRLLQVLSPEAKVLALDKDPLPWPGPLAVLSKGPGGVF